MLSTGRDAADGCTLSHTASFFGIVSGLTLLIVSYFLPDARALAIPALLMLFPSLIYGMR